MKFTTHSLLDIGIWLEENLKSHPTVKIQVLNPDISNQHYSGEFISLEEENYLYRSYKTWVNLAELHQCKLHLPQKINRDLIELTFEKLNINNSFHLLKIENKEEKYGVDSKFFSINKNEEPTFLYAYKKALEAVKISTKKQVLNLGINKGDEFKLIENLLDNTTFCAINFIGIDHSKSALEYAQKRFSKKHVSFYQHDINKLKTLNLPKSDLIISIGTLQSPEINYKPFLMSLVQEYLSPKGSLILGFPNSRWIDKELIYGAKAPNYAYSELSLLFNDVIFAKKYLQQKKFRVTITGREYIFLTATSIK